MRRRAFTIMDVLAGLAVVGAAAALGAVAVAQQKREAAGVSNLNNIGQTMRDFLAYADDSRGKMPNFGLPNDPEADAAWYNPPDAIHTHASVTGKAAIYPSVAFDWPRLLARHFVGERAYWHCDDGPEIIPLRFPLPPGAEEVGPQPSKYKYTLTMVTAPSMWTWPGRVGMDWPDLIPEMEVVVKERIAFPSRKGVLLFDRDEQQGVFLIAFADGGASVRRPVDGNPAAQPVFYMHAVRGRAVMSTIEGYFGWDY